MNDRSVETAERPQRADARRNRERILESAREVFAADGAEAQMDDVARRAGVGVGTLYRHFPTKETLLLALVRDKLRIFAENARLALDSDGEPGEILRGLLRRNAEVASRDTVMQELLAGLGDDLWAQLVPEHGELEAITSQLIERAQRAKSVREDLRASDISMLMCGLGAAMSHCRPGFDWHRHLDLILDSLAPRPTSQPA
jgi:AcrR family transcriptional regulator